MSPPCGGADVKPVKLLLKDVEGGAPKLLNDDVGGAEYVP